MFIFALSDLSQVIKKKFLVKFSRVSNIKRLLYAGLCTALVSVNAWPHNGELHGRALQIESGMGLTMLALTLNGDFTVEAWVRFAPGEPVNNQDGLFSNSNNTQDINFYAQRMRLYDTTTGHDAIVANTPVTAGVWTHVALVRDQGFLSIYLNGVRDVGPVSHNASLTFDRVFKTVAGTTSGQIDELRVWNIGRSAQQITATMRQELAVDTPNLLLYYKFNEADPFTPDSAGPRDLTLTAGTSLVDSTVPFDHDAPDAGGSGDDGTMRSIGLEGLLIDPISLDSDFTIESWIKFAEGTVINNADGLVANSDGTQDINFWNAQARLHDRTSGWDHIIATTQMSTGRWDHVAMTRENGRLRLYINGELNQSSPNLHTNPLIVDRVGQTVAGALEGELRETRIWGVARTQTQIAATMQGDVDAQTPGLLVYYQYAEDSSGQVIDLAGGDNNATLGVGVTIETGSTTPAEPTGTFVDEAIIRDLALPTSMAFLPDGRMLVTLKNGGILLAADPTDPQGSVASYMTITNINSGNDERGLMNVAVDPQFASNGYIYAYYSHNSTQRFRVSRFVHQENSGGDTSRGLLSSETLLWQDNENFSSCCHYGGGLVFAPDGTLLLTTGEEFDAAQSTNLARAGGKVHRFNTDGSIPANNPLYDGSPGATNAQGQLQTIVAYGLRNPFRAYMDADTNRLYIGEVGGNNNATSREDIHVYPFNATQPALVNMGWPICEGACFEEGNPGNPIWSYPHAGSGASVTGGVVLRDDAFPIEINGAYFYGDWVDSEIRYLTLDYTDPNIPATASTLLFSTSLRPQSFTAGPDNSLYWLGTDNNFGNGGNPFVFGGEIHRIRFNPANQPPMCSIEASATSGAQVPLTITFNAAVNDPDSNDLSYEWDLGDGATSAQATFEHAYQQVGQYVVTLFVSDGQNTASCGSTTITVGQPPSVQIQSPIDGSLFRAGDTIQVSASATDGLNNPIPSNQIQISAVFVHNEHVHPGLAPTPGNTASFDVPTMGHDYSSDTGYRIFATATDTNGLSSTASVNIFPDKVNIDVALVPQALSGVEIALDEINRVQPFVHDTLKDFEHSLRAEIEYCVNDRRYVFADWRMGEAVISTETTAAFNVPETDVNLRAHYDDAGPCSKGFGQAFNSTGQAGLAIDPLILSGDFTIESWIWFAPGTSVTNADGVFRNSAGTQDINFWRGTLRLHDRTNGGWDPVIANTALPTGIWTHVAVTRENGVLRLYLNGVLNATGSNQHVSPITVDTIGSTAAGSLQGRLDETRIWSLARSAEQLQSSLYTGVSAQESALELYYRYDGEGNTVVDLIGARNSVLVGGTSKVESTVPLQ